jgi:predicted CXXCH cytochrome family protein
MKGFPIITGAFVIALAISTAFGQNYSGATTTFPGCGTSGCHDTAERPEFLQWMGTAHASAYDSLSAFVQQTARCLECHTTGWDTTMANLGADDFVTVADPYEGNFNVTIDDSTEFFKKTNVQCEACHGPTEFSVNHPPPTLITAEDCGQCHQGQHTPYLENWLESKHAISNSNANPFLQGKFRNDPNCSGCHTFQGLIQFVGTTPADTLNNIPDIANPPGDAALPVVCATCHDPHDAMNEGQLRLPAADLCVKCHNPQLAKLELGDEPHNTPSAMFAGEGAFEFPGFTYRRMEDESHQTTPPASDRKCVTCHVFMTAFDDGGTPEDPSDDVLANTGHTFEPRIESCEQAGCHVNGLDIPPGSTLEFDHEGHRTLTRSLLDSLETILASVSSEDSTTQAFAEALFNLQFVENDKSLGVHNPSYTVDVLRNTITYIDTVLVTSVEPRPDELAGIPKAFALYQNYPNPFNPTTKVRFDVPRAGHVKLIIYNALGQEVQTLVDERLTPSSYEVEFNAANLSSGLYFYKLVTDNFVTTKKMLLLK